MIYKAKSILIGRKGPRDDEGNAPVFVEVFDVNDPHKTANVFPKETLDFPTIHKIIIKGLDVDYLLGGSDIVIDNLTEVSIEQGKTKAKHLLISGKQKK